MMKIHFLGGAAEVGASCVLVEFGARRILFDCGMRMKGDDPLPDLELVQRAGGLDAIVVSHAHMDHTGSLPVISDAYPLAPIYMTAPTLAITRVLLNDSLKIMSHEAELPTFNRRQVEQTLKRVVTVPLQDLRRVFDAEALDIQFFQAGHILGAAMVSVTSKAGSFFYTGDVSAGGQKTVGGLSVPARLRPDACVVESTYGSRLHASRERELARMLEMVGAALEQGGKVLIPAFAVGRAQEVVLLLRSALANGRIPAAKVYVDGMVREVCRIYKEYPNFLRESLAKRIWKGQDVFFNDTVRSVETTEQREQLLASEEPCVIVASSGMLSGGASAFYAERLADGENNLIAITGYQDEESPGRALQNLFEETGPEQVWTINGKQVTLKCQLGTYGLSAHADKTELMGLVERLRPARTFVVHGDAAARTALGQALNQHLRGRVYVPGNGASFLVEAGGKAESAARILPASLGHVDLPMETSELEPLSEYLRKEYPEQSWTAGELLRIWGADEADEAVWTKLLNESVWFECDAWRLYLYRPVEGQQTVLPVRMEVNAALAGVAQFFSPETGLYKKGARVDKGIILLSFRFPQVAVKRFSEQIYAFEQFSGWSVELNQNPDTSYLKPMIEKLLSDEAGLCVKVAWFLDQGRVEAVLKGAPTEVDKLCTCFKEETGLELTLSYPGQKAEPSAKRAPGGELVGKSTCSMQDAMAQIEFAFEPEPVTIYKISKRSDHLGDYLEVQFLTPQLGERYQTWLTSIAKDSGWRVVWNPNPRQQELIAVARRLIEPHGPIIKGPGIVAVEALVRVTAVFADCSTKDDLQKQFEQETGYALELLAG